MPTFRPRAWISSVMPLIPLGNLMGSGMIWSVMLSRLSFMDQQSSAVSISATSFDRGSGDGEH
jgi:hypothetical protein